MNELAKRTLKTLKIPGARILDCTLYRYSTRTCTVEVNVSFLS